LPLVLSLASSLLVARAEAAKVVIVRPAGTSPELKETVSRLHGEVLSLGLEVAIVEAGPPGGTPLDSRADTDAIIEVIGDGTPSAVEIRVFERGPQGSRRAVVSRVALEPDADNAPARLAIRAVEALRSSLVESALDAKGQRPATPVAEAPLPAVTQSPQREPAGPTETVDLQAGPVLLTSLDGVGPALMPVVEVGWNAQAIMPSLMPSWLALHAALAGFGSRPSVETATGSARVAQQYAVVGVRGCLGTRALQPCGALAAGVLRTAIDGQAAVPEDAHSIERWSFLLDASLGARLRVTGRYHLTLAAHVQVAEPYVAIHFVDTLVATSGRPNLLLSLTLGAWL